MIIDCHCHAGTGDGFTASAGGRAPLDRYLRRAARAGIERTVLFAPLHPDYARANREVARIVSEHPGRFYGFAFVHALRDRGRIAHMIEEAVVRYDFRGIKVHRLDARISREICEAARALSLPVLYDIAGEATVVDRLAREFPDVTFIIPHLGSFVDDWRAQLRVIQQMIRHPNIYADTSAVRHFDLLVEAVRRAGSERLLYGSDGPWVHPGVELAKIHALGLAKNDAARVLGGNCLRLIERPAAGRVA